MAPTPRAREGVATSLEKAAILGTSTDKIFEMTHQGDQNTQLRFSSRPAMETYPRWHYESKTYLSDHDWRVEKGSSAVMEFVASGRSKVPAVRKAKKGNALAFSDKPEADCLDEYDFTVFKVSKRGSGGASKSSADESGGWWQQRATGPSSNPHNLRKGKTICVHGETIYGAVERRAVKEQKEEEIASMGGGGVAREGELFNVRGPPMRPRAKEDREAVEKLRAAALMPSRPSTYVDTTAKKDAAEPSAGPGPPKPAWISSTLLEDALEHSSPGAYNALRYVERRHRKFALAQSVAKLNHKMSAKRERRKSEDKRLEPLRRTIDGLEKRQGVLERENQELQGLVRELHSVIEEHKRAARQKQREPTRKKHPPADRQRPSGGSRAASSKPSFSSVQTRKTRGARRAASPSPVRSQPRRPSTSPQGSARKQKRTQWRQPGMTAKQRAMSERTQAFQQAMSAITAGGDGTGNVEKTLEAFARAQAEQELREASGGDGSPTVAAKDSLLEGLDKKLREVGASFLRHEGKDAGEDVSGSDEYGGVAAKAKEAPGSKSGKVVVVPTMEARAGQPEGPMDDHLRGDLMQAVQRELQKQIGGPVAAVEEARPSTQGAQGDAIRAFMEDTNRKLMDISRHLADLQKAKNEGSKAIKAADVQEEERVMISRPRQRIFAGPSRDDRQAASSPKSVGAMRPPLLAEGAGKTEDGTSSSAREEPKHLVVGPDHAVRLVADRRLDLPKLSALSVRNIEEGRQEYLRRQRQSDEFVYANSASEEFDPVKIAENLADLIIDDLVDDSARELSEVMDSICDNIFQREFGQR